MRDEINYFDNLKPAKNLNSYDEDVYNLINSTYIWIKIDKEWIFLISIELYLNYYKFRKYNQ